MAEKSLGLKNGGKIGKFETNYRIYLNEIEINGGKKCYIEKKM